MRPNLFVPFLTLLIFAPSGVRAGPVTWEFAGEVNFILDGPEILVINGIDIGTPFSGSFTFESTTPDLFPDNLSAGLFVNGVTSLSGTLGDVPFVWDGSRIDINVINSVQDSYTLRSQVTILGRTEDFGLIFQDRSATIFSTDEIPLVPFPLDGLNMSLFFIGSQKSDIGITGVVDTLVPEPTTLLLLGLGGVFLLRPLRRRKGSRNATIGISTLLSWSAFVGIETPARAQEVCGCMDMVFLIDVTGSFQTQDRINIKDQLRSLELYKQIGMPHMVDKVQGLLDGLLDDAS